jgi:hypothetical protein
MKISERKIVYKYIRVAKYIKNVYTITWASEQVPGMYLKKKQYNIIWVRSVESFFQIIALIYTTLIPSGPKLQHAQ